MTFKQTDAYKELRQRAEAFSDANDACSGHHPRMQPHETLTPEQTQQLLRKLQTNQIELEMQNEELRDTQKQLEALHASYFDLYDMAPVGYLTISAQGLIQKANLTGADILGTGKDDLTNTLLSKYIFHEDQDMYYLLRKSILQANKAHVWEMRMARPDGSTAWVEFQAVPRHDGEYWITFKNITERKQSEECLLQSETKYRYVFDNAADAIFIHDTEARMLAVNPKACEQLGYTHDELMLLWVDTVESPEQFVHAPERLARMLEQGYHSFETVHLRKDGSQVPTEVSSRIIIWDGRPAIMSICRDITERKVAEAALRESETKYRAMIESFDGYMYICSQDFRIEFMNARLIRQTGRDATGELCYKALHDLDTTCEWCINQDVISGKSVLREIQSPKDGRWYEINSSPVYSENGTTSKQSMITDITARKRAEEELLLLEQKFHQAQKLESLGIMAGGIAHDFNNLLQSILGNMELASRNLAADSSAYEHISNAIISGRHANHLTSLMLTYAGKGFIFKKTLNLNDLIRENVQLMRVAASAAVSMELDLSEEALFILADTAQIQQVVMNLITNAAESFEDKVGTIKLTTRIQNCDTVFLNGSLLEEKPEAGHFVLLEVRDNGCGMNKETLERLFDPFFTTKFTGRGLGMSAVMGIMKTHNGALFVESVPGEGTTFRMLFPSSCAATQSAIQEPLSPPAESSSQKPLSGVILVVDDEKSVLKVCAKMVKLCGFKVITACDGIDAVTKFREHADEISIVLMDLTMPNMDGITAIGELFSIRPDIKVILSSGYSKDELSERISSQPPAGFICKPYSMNTLEAEIRRVASLDNSRQF